MCHRRTHMLSQLMLSFGRFCCPTHTHKQQAWVCVGELPHWFDGSAAGNRAWGRVRGGRGMLSAICAWLHVSTLTLFTCLIRSGTRTDEATQSTRGNRGSRQRVHFTRAVGPFVVVVDVAVGPINPTDTRPFHTSGLRVKMGNGAASR